MSAPTRPPLPQLSDELFPIDGGLEASLTFDDRLDLPDFAASGLPGSEAGRSALTRYSEGYAEIARRHRTGLVPARRERSRRATPTWSRGITMTSAEEAVGVQLAAREIGMPAVRSFTVETDGTLPDGTQLADSIARTDDETDGNAAVFMVDCAHPTHFSELDEAKELDAGDPAELAEQYVQPRATHPGLTVLGGGCGTHEVHLATIAQALRPVAGGASDT